MAHQRWEGTRDNKARRPDQKALHLRYLPVELYEQILKAARYRNMSLTRWCADVLRHYLAVGSFREAGMCQICKRRVALSAPVKLPKGMTSEASRLARGMTMMDAKGATTMEPKTTKPEARQPAQPKTCRHDLAYHPGCRKADGSHSHGSWWPRERCDQCRTVQ
jgi:hypothetical protein